MYIVHLAAMAPCFHGDRRILLAFEQARIFVPGMEFYRLPSHIGNQNRSPPRRLLWAATIYLRMFKYSKPTHGSGTSLPFT